MAYEVHLKWKFLWELFTGRALIERQRDDIISTDAGVRFASMQAFPLHSCRASQPPQHAWAPLTRGSCPMEKWWTRAGTSPSSWDQREPYVLRKDLA